MSGGAPRIWLSPPHLSGNEETYVARILASNWVAPVGPDIAAFEQEFAAAVDMPHAVALASGTAALHLALRLAGVTAGDEVLCSTFTFAASANAIAYERARPVFVDCSPETWNADPSLIAAELDAAARQDRVPKAAVIVDLYGQSADYDPIVAACHRYGVALIEDAAEALGATYRGRPVGRFGIAGAFSFNGNKIITTSGGGMLVTHDGDLAERARYLATQARDMAVHYEHSVVGYNYRLSNVLAGIGRAQLEVLPDRVAARRAIFAGYRERLEDLPGLAFMPEADFGRSSRWLTCITIRPDAFGADREDVRLALDAANIEARPLWKPMHLQPVFAGCRTVGGAVAERLFRDGLCLPSGSALTPADLDRICSIIRACSAT